MRQMRAREMMDEATEIVPGEQWFGAGKPERGHGRSLEPDGSPALPRLSTAGGRDRPHSQATPAVTAPGQVWASPGTSAFLSGAPEDFFPEARACLLSLLVQKRKAWSLGRNCQPSKLPSPFLPKGLQGLSVNRVVRPVLLFLSSG